MYDNQDIQEKAPPGAKYERMVKHIKKRYAQDGLNGLTDKEKAIAYATAWKQYGKTRKEEVEQLDERRREEKGTPRNDLGKTDKAYRAVKQMMRGMSGKPAGQRKKVPGQKPPAAGEYGAPKSPAQKVALRRAAEKRSQEMQSSRFDHFEMEGDNLQEKYLYTYLYERNYDALDKDMDGDKDFADVMIARMIASGKSREEAIKATMSKEYNKKGKKVKISDEFSDWRDELGEALSKKSPFVDVMPKDDVSGDESESLKAARKRQQPNQKVTEENLCVFAESIGGYLVEAEQLNEFLGAASKLPSLVRAVTTLAKSPAARSVIVKGPKGFKPPTPKPVVTPGTKPAVPVPVKPVPTPKPGPATKPTPAPAKPQVKPEVEKATKPAVKKPVKTAVATAAATSAAAALLQPLVKPKPASETDVAKGQKPAAGTPRGGKPGAPGGRGPGGGPIPFGMPKMEYQGHIGFTQNPQ